MNTKNMPLPNTVSSTASRIRAALVACALTVLAVPVHASVVIPPVPLQSGNTVAPNILFILDDSGSMDWLYMPDDVQGTSPVDISDQAYTRNTIYYNPAVTYRPWRKSDGSFMEVRPYNSAFSNRQQASGTIDLGSAARTFFVPKAGATALGDASQYFRYRFLTDGTARRCELNPNDNNNWTLNCTAVTNFSWTGLDGEAVTRTLAEEKQNFATWYSYHRSRMKVAKAGASYAFSELGENIRVGYRTLHNQSNFDIPVNVDGGLFRDQSPGSGNRSTWYSRLLSASGSGNTPSARALNEAGQYFSTTTASGPWGPEAPENQLSCRQNFAILTSDGYWNETPVTTTDGDDVAGLVITSPTGQTYQYTPQRPYSDGISNTLADVAMRYWKTDLRPDLDNDVPTTPGNPAFWQHMVTFGISLGLAGTLNPETDLPALTDGTKSWPDPHPTRNATRIDDMWHATVNGRGEFVVVTDPEAFAAGLTEALDSITERTNSGSNVAANSVALRDETRIFQASYVGGRWTGEVAAYPISAAGVAANPVWRATDPGNIPAFEARKAQVFTFGDNQGRNFFAHRNAGLGAIDGYNVAEYLLGNAAGEERNSGTLRNRTSVLGDIVHSSPAFVGDVDSGALFVGANDGMMHAFDSETGKELFAYVPGGISNERLRLLTDPAYSHQYYVDGPIAVSSQTQTPGVNYLIGTLGRGGKGLYALDVTNPKTFAAGNVLWDTAATNLTGWTTQNAQADLGMVLNRPLIARTNGRTGNQNSAMLPAMAIFGNGINSTSGRASLFIVDLKTGALVRNIRVGPAGDTNNGITSVRGWDEDGDGLIDYVFAADMKGNIWKFDLDYFDVDKWGVADGGTIQGQLKRASGGDPLIATGRPITGGMQVTFHPTTYETWLMFGTGKYLEESDINSTGQERWYGVIDNGTRITNIGTQLTQRNLVVSANIDGTPVRGFQPHAPLPADSRGWFVNLQTPPTGQTLPPSERMVAEPLMVGRVLVAASILPSADPCDAGGTGYLNAIDAFTGTSVQRPFFDVNNDGSFDDDVIGYGDGSVPVGSVNLGIAMPTSPTVVENLLVAGGSLGTTGAVGINNPLVKGRISWREILGD